jgi:hypothetical protein
MFCQWSALARKKRTPVLSKSTKRNWSASTCVPTPMPPRHRRGPRAPLMSKTRSKPRSTYPIFRARAMSCARSRSKKKRPSIFPHARPASHTFRRQLQWRRRPPRPLWPRRLQPNPRLRSRRLSHRLRDLLRPRRSLPNGHRPWSSYHRSLHRHLLLPRRFPSLTRLLRRLQFPRGLPRQHRRR